MNDPRLDINALKGEFELNGFLFIVSFVVLFSPLLLLKLIYFQYNVKNVQSLINKSEWIEDQVSFLYQLSWVEDHPKRFPLNLSWKRDDKGIEIEIDTHIRGFCFEASRKRFTPSW